MRIFLDDERPTPEGWIRTYWPNEVIALLNAGGVTELSLDHDLGDDTRGTGYDVIVWIEEAVATRNFRPPENLGPFCKRIGTRKNDCWSSIN